MNESLTYKDLNRDEIIMNSYIKSFVDCRPIGQLDCRYIKGNFVRLNETWGVVTINRHLMSWGCKWAGNPHGQHSTASLLLDCRGASRSAMKTLYERGKWSWWPCAAKSHAELIFRAYLAAPLPPQICGGQILFGLIKKKKKQEGTSSQDELMYSYGCGNL